MLEKLSNKYLKMGKDWLTGEYGTYKGKTTIMTIDDEDTSFTQQLITAVKSHPEVQDSFYDTCLGDPCIGIEFKPFYMENCLLEEDGAEFYSLTNSSFEEFEEILSLIDEETPFPDNNGYYRVFWKGFEAELWLVHDIFNQIRIHVYRSDDEDFFEVYPEEITSDEISDLDDILTTLKEAIEYFA